MSEGTTSQVEGTEGRDRESCNHLQPQHKQEAKPEGQDTHRPTEGKGAVGSREGAPGQKPPAGGREKGWAPGVGEVSARPRGMQLGWREGSTLAVPQAWAVAGGQRLCDHQWLGLTRHTQDLVRSQAPHAPDLFLGDTLY